MKTGLRTIPPFQDAHVHLMVNGRPTTLDGCQAILDQFIFNGIMAVADMGHQSGLGLGLKKGLDQNQGLSIRLCSAGWVLHKKGRYGGFLGKAVSGKREIRKAILELAEAGADFIKVLNSGIVSLADEKPVTEGGFSEEEWKVIQEEAAIHGLPIRCHANSDQAIRQAVDFGVSSIEHGFFINRETLQIMAERGVAWTPTAIALLSLKAFLSIEEQKRVDRIVDRHLEALQYAASIGVKLQVGTDSGSKGVRAGESFFKELQLFKKAGLTLDQIISAACLEPAEIEKGNYLLVENNFIETERVEAVIVMDVEIQSQLSG